jgi:hypothetical protein
MEIAGLSFPCLTSVAVTVQQRPAACELSSFGLAFSDRAGAMAA